MSMKQGRLAEPVIRRTRRRTRASVSQPNDCPRRSGWPCCRRSSNCIPHFYKISHLAHRQNPITLQSLVAKFYSAPLLVNYLGLSVSPGSLVSSCGNGKTMGVIGCMVSFGEVWWQRHLLK